MFAGYTLYKAVWKDRIKELKGSDPFSIKGSEPFLLGRGGGGAKQAVGDGGAGGLGDGRF